MKKSDGTVDAPPDAVVHQRVVVVKDNVVVRVVSAPHHRSPEVRLQKGEISFPDLSAQVGWRMNIQMILNPPGDV